MNADSLAKPLVVLPGQGQIVRAFGDEVLFHLTGEQTNGNLVMFTTHTPPGGGPPPHRHANEDEWWLVQEGTVSFFIDGQWQLVPVGSIVFAPRGSVHTFRNDGLTPSRMLISASPSGFEIFFRRCAEEFSKPSGPAMERLIAIAGEHGIEFVKP